MIFFLTCLFDFQFWSVYMSCVNQYKDAVRATLEQIDVAHRMLERYSDDFEFVTTAQGLYNVIK